MTFRMEFWLEGQHLFDAASQQDNAWFALDEARSIARSFANAHNETGKEPKHLTLDAVDKRVYRA